MKIHERLDIGRYTSVKKRARVVVLKFIFLLCQNKYTYPSLLLLLQLNFFVIIKRFRFLFNSFVCSML